MFPYPSGAGLHVGHPLGYIASDIFARYKRLKALMYCIPKAMILLDSLPNNMRSKPTTPCRNYGGKYPTLSRTLDRMGFSFDWSREVRTSNPDYYRWTQWIFIQLFESYYCTEQNKARSIKELIENIRKSERWTTG